MNQGQIHNRTKSQLSYVAVTSAFFFTGILFGQNPSQYQPTPQLGQVYPQSAEQPGTGQPQPTFQMGNQNLPATNSPATNKMNNAAGVDGANPTAPGPALQPSGQPITADDVPSGGATNVNNPPAAPIGVGANAGEDNEDLSVREAKRLTAEFDRAAGRGSQSGPPADLLEQLRNLSMRPTKAGSWARRTLVRLLLVKGGGGPAAAEDFISRAPAENSRELYYYYARQVSRSDPGRASAALDRILARPEKDRLFVLAGILQLRLNLRLKLMDRARDNYYRLLRLEPNRSQSEALMEQMGLLDDFYYWAARYHLAPGSRQNIRQALDYLKPFEDDPVLGSRTAFVQSIWAPAAVRLRRQMAALYSIGRL